MGDAHAAMDAQQTHCRPGPILQGSRDPAKEVGSGPPPATQDDEDVATNGCGKEKENEDDEQVVVSQITSSALGNSGSRFFV